MSPKRCKTCFQKIVHGNNAHYLPGKKYDSRRLGCVRSSAMIDHVNVRGHFSNHFPDPTWFGCHYCGEVVVIPASSFKSGNIVRDLRRHFRPIPCRPYVYWSDPDKEFEELFDEDLARHANKDA